MKRVFGWAIIMVGLVVAAHFGCPLGVAVFAAAVAVIAAFLLTLIMNDPAPFTLTLTACVAAVAAAATIVGALSLAAALIVGALFLAAGTAMSETRKKNSWVHFWTLFTVHIIQMGAIFGAVFLDGWGSAIAGVAVLGAWLMFLHAEEQRSLHDIA